MLQIITKSKPMYGNALLYDTATKEYVYTQRGKEIWRIHEINGDLRKYFITMKSNGKCIDSEEIEQLTENPIWETYSNSCEYNH